ncbi:MAG TPA: DegT/DnrJ/EryC1/StrS aminotransferase family protein [Armatimonadota bacterium]
MIPIAKPYIGQDEQAAIAEVLASGMLASGPRVHDFERAFADYCHAPEATACSSGTSGLCVSVKALDLPVGSKILTTPFSFIATANCVLYGGLTPVFADVDPDTFMLSAATVREALESDPSIRAILPVHLYGQACEIHEMVEIARAHNAYVIEDCAQAHGASEHGVPVGAIGDLGIFSFYPTKNMMTGEGGMITGRNAELMERCRLIINQGAAVRYQHTALGFNYRMTSIAASIGLCQLKRLPSWTEQRQRNAARLDAGLRDLSWLTVPVTREDTSHVYHQYVLKVTDRARLQQHLQDAGVGSAVHYPCTIPDQPYYQSQGYTSEHLPVARQLADEVLSLPVHPAVSEDDLQTIIAAVRSFTPLTTANSVTA